MKPFRRQFNFNLIETIRRAWGFFFEVKKLRESHRADWTDLESVKRLLAHLDGIESEIRYLHERAENADGHFDPKFASACETFLDVLQATLNKAE